MNQTKYPIANRNGFTLIEVLVALGIGIFMMMAIYGVINHAQRSSTGIERKVVAQQDERSAIELMAMEIRMASYNMYYSAGNWVNAATCNGAAANQLWKGIQEATPFAITVEMDISDNCTANSNPACMTDADEIIRYNYVPAEFYITRTTNCGTAQAFLGDTTASGNPRTVRVINDINGNGVYDEGVDVPVFRYFDGQGAEITSAQLPASIPDIRRIEITLVVETENVDPNTGARRRMTYSTSVIPRNHLPNPQ
jgi:prepilin-type N-terminal cleavage/methylation domain-containing protein